MEKRKGGRKARVFKNSYKNQFDAWGYGFDCFGLNSLKYLPSDVDDIVTGVSYLSEDTSKFKGSVKCLSKRKIVLCLASLDEISTKNIQALLGLGKSQTHNYFMACVVCIKLFDLVGI